MTIISFTFIIFAFATLIVYYIVPKKYQWCVLLAANGVFYYKVGLKAALFVLFTATTIYFAARLMESISARQRSLFEEHKETLTKEEKKAIKRRNQKRRKVIMLMALLSNILILCATKYTHFVLAQVNHVLSVINGKSIVDDLNIIVPLGISFYTFQSVGYLLDVYWEKIASQKNYLKFLLFVSFFPQMTQGPISEYGQLSNELFKEHTFSYKNYSYGIQRMLWGFAKKMLVADVLGVYVKNVFVNYESYTGITTLLGAFCYSIQIYADFSGYMDIMCGLCETLGIRLKENFDRPYFSKSIAEYWRRWHISLGDWFKNYVYYPIGMSNWSHQLAKKTKHRFGAHIGNTLPATIALLIVWTATGLWHGASWSYIVWGLLNGAVIIFSMWMEPVYESLKAKCNINDERRGYRCFQIVRTFILVTFIKVLPEVGGLRKGLGLWKHIFTDLRIPSSIYQLLEFTGNDRIGLILATFIVIAMFAVSCLQSKYQVRHLFNKLPTPIRLVSISCGVIFVVVFGVLMEYNYGGGGFMYEGF